jgi:uncharacterized protein YkwD
MAFRPLSSLVVVSALAAALLAPAPSGADGLVNCEVTPEDQAMSAEEQSFLDLLNAYRQDNGLPPLAVSDSLNRAAAWMANDMYQHHYVSHTDSAGRNAGARVLDCGYHTGAAEIIAVGKLDPAAALEAFKGSPPHHAIMVDDWYKAAGVGLLRTPDGGAYWVVDLGLELEESASPPAALYEGWTHLATWEGPEVAGVPAIAAFLAQGIDPDSWVTVAEYDVSAGTWRQLLKDAPLDSFNTLDELAPGASYWIYSTTDASLALDH